MNKPPFNPNQKFEVADKPKFNPGQSFEVVDQETLSPIDQEAELGFVNRAKYAIEPLSSNREALLRQEYGDENVTKDKSGELYLRQGGQFLPVNQDGVGLSDVAEFAGATPEMLGAGAGAIAGMGVGSIPGAILGGVVGSGVRQGLSAMIGTPQVASPGERALELGASGVFSAAVPVVGKALKPVADVAGAGIKRVAKGASAYAKKAGDYLEEILRTTPHEKQILENTTEVALEQTPRELADQSGRQIVQDEAEKLAKISKNQNLPTATTAQTIGGKAILAEDRLMDTPLVGGKVRSYVDNQLKAVKQNLEKEAGEFINSDSDAFEVGSSVKNILKKTIQSTREVAKNLYNVVDESSKNAMIGARTFSNKYKNKAGELGLINPDGTRSAYDATSRLTRDEFSKLQNVFFDGMDSIKNIGSPKVRFQAIDSLRRTVKNQADEWRESNPNASRILNQFHDELDSMAEKVLNKEVPRLGKVYQKAREQWAKFKNDEDFLNKFLPENLGEEKVVKKLMGDSSNIKRLKGIVGEEPIKQIGRSHVKDILSGLAKSGVARADTALSAIKKQKAQIIEAIGEKSYKNLTENLYYLNRLNQGLNVQRSSLYNIFDESRGGLRGLGVRLLTSAKTIAESQGKTSSQLAKDAVNKTSTPISKASKKVFGISPKTRGGLSNLFSDSPQREFSSGQVIDLEPINIGLDERGNGRRPTGR